MPLSQEQRDAFINRRVEKKIMLEKYLAITNDILAGSTEGAACKKYGIPIMTYRHFVDYSADYNEDLSVQNADSDLALLRTSEDRFIYDLLGPSGYARDDFWEAYDITTHKALTNREKTAVDLRYKDDYILDEIAEILEVSRERARQIIKRALRKLTNYKYRIYFELGVKEAQAYEESKNLLHDISEKRCEVIARKQELEHYMSDITTLQSLKKVMQDTLKKGSMTKEELYSLTELLSKYQQIESITAPDTSLPVEDLNLSPRSYNLLKRAGINTLEDILKLSFSDLQHLRWAGAKSCAEIVAKVQFLGYELKAV